MRTSQERPAKVEPTRVTSNGVELDVRSVGHGEPILLIHGSIFADAFAPVVPEFADYQVITYNRRGLGRSGRSGPATIPDQAADARAVLDAFGLKSANVVGHSYGAVISLELARSSPERVRTLTLLEPPLFEAAPSSGPQFMAAMQPVFEAYKSGNKPAALAGFLELVAGPDMRATIDRNLPTGAYDMAVADIETFFQVEMPAMPPWQLGEGAKQIKMPVLSLVGQDSAPLFKEVGAALPNLMPQTESAEIAHCDHLLPQMRPHDVAEAIKSFVARHRS